jgi:protein involved in sex pheromone biosynthesis
MKTLPIASLALVLALSGCASASSLDELESRVKQLEYDNCIERRMDFWESMTTEGIYEKALKDCADLSP